MSEIEAKIARLGLVLPECPAPVASYVVAAKSGDLVFLSGQTPIVDGVLRYVGKVGKEVPVEDAYAGAKICALRLIAELKFIAGDLDRVKRIVKVNGYVNCEGDFGLQPKVINGASDLFVEVFGEKGRHARVAIGAAALPGNAAVEVEAIAELDK